MRFYVNGAIAGTFTSHTDGVTGVRTAQEPLSVGAGLDNGTTANGFFHGNISDVRVWSSVRTDTEIRSNFQQRLSAAGSESGLVVNWVFDTESGTVGGTQDVQGLPSTSADGTLTNASYAPVISVYFRPFSTAVCPAGTRAGVYQCDFRTSAATGATWSLSPVPNNLSSIYVKAWGGGGGAYDVGLNERAGGAGGFSGGLLQTIGGASNIIAGTILDIVAGGYGTGSVLVNNGAAGGAASGVFTTTPTAGIVAGGGGGASYSIANVTGSGNCGTATGAASCGLGGTGGGAGGAALTTRAPDESSSCGGRGGDNTTGTTPPTSGGD